MVGITWPNEQVK